MIGDRYICCDAHRRSELVKQPAFSGIDYVEVRVGATTADPTFIDIVLVNPLQKGQLSLANFEITGGVRFPAPACAALHEEGDPVTRYGLEILGGELTDFSDYRLSIVSGPDNANPPAVLDHRLSTVEFSFKIGCPSDFDCAADAHCADDSAPPAPDPTFDYRVRDYPGFRRQMLDRMATLVPNFREDDPSDLTTTVLEALAYRADQQSYRLDWVGTEAFLSTARARISLTRHARLVDYPVGEGASARVFARFMCEDKFADGTTLPPALPLLVRTTGLPPVVKAEDYAKLLPRNPIVFETVAPLTIWQWRNAIAFHTWSDDECRLAKGAVAATLRDDSGGAGPLTVGDFLLLAETRSPDTLEQADARPERRHIVRITRTTPVVDVLMPGATLVTVEWSPDDALPFDLIIQARKLGAIVTAPTQTCAIAAGNIMLADHGASMPPSSALGLGDAETENLRPVLSPPMPKDNLTWRPRLNRGNIARIGPVELADMDPPASARSLANIQAADCHAAFQLDDDFAVWTARKDLLRSGKFDRDFVVETDIDGHLALRFGDGVNGLRPTVGNHLSVSGRFGSGIAGNIGRDALAHTVVPIGLLGKRFSVSNPLAARGGEAEESLSSIRASAPVAFRTQERAVTAADYAAAAMRHPDVANAQAIARWTGSWQTMFVYLDRMDGKAVDSDFAFRREMMAHMEFYRLMGFDVALRGARNAPLNLEFDICAKPDSLRSTVAIQVRNALRPTGPNGERGFFHPDNFTFGSPLYLSQVMAAIMAVAGVQSVTPRRFERLDRSTQDAVANGVIRPGPLEVLQLADDPSFPEQGRIGLTMGGGQ